MLKRVLEPEVMDAPGDADEYDAMDHGEVNDRFVADLLAAWSTRCRRGQEVVRVFDSGAGTAQIPIALCRAWPAARVVAIDLADGMLSLAQRNVAAAGLAAAIELQKVDAKQLPLADGVFDVVMSNSIVHHLAEPRGALAEMVRVAAPGGLLFVRDLLRPPDQATVDRLVARYAATAPARGQQLFRDSLHAALSLAEIGALVQTLGFRSASVQATSDRHWTWVAWRL